MPDATCTLGLLRFRPVLSEKIWGGRRLEEVFGRELPAGKKIGESWEVSGLREALTPVAEGPFLGADLYRLAAARGEEIFGSSLAARCREDFPLLVKFIDASDVLSVQVHPADDYARSKGYPNGKSEAWVVVAADPGAFVYRGFEAGVGADDFRKALDANDPEAVARCLKKVEARAGDVIDLPAGTVHAIGKGLLLCEIQQSSDVTYRIHDWGRVGFDGRPRPLHLDEAWDVMDFGSLRPQPSKPVPSRAAKRCETGGPSSIAVLTNRDSPPFHLEVATAEASARVEPPVDRFEIICVVAGRGRVVSPSGEESNVEPGSTCVVPASWDAYEVRPEEPMRWVRSWVA